MSACASFIKASPALVSRSAEGTHAGRFLGVEPTGRRATWEFADLYRVGTDGRINWHFYVTDWNIVRLQLLGEAPDLPATPERRAVMAEG